jgi:hypothetical protein
MPTGSRQKMSSTSTSATSTKQPQQQSVPSRSGNKRRRTSSSSISKHKKRKNNNAQAKEELFQVEKIVGSKVDKSGMTLFKTRWKGYTAADVSSDRSLADESILILYANYPSCSPTSHFIQRQRTLGNPSKTWPKQAT